MAANSFIYGAVDPRTGGYCYVGKTCIGVKRWRIHLRELRRGCHSNRRLQYLHDKLARLGGGKIEFRIIEECRAEDLDRREIALIAALRDGGARLCNMSAGGDGASRPCSEATKEKMRKAHAGRQPSEECHRRSLEANKGRKKTLQETTRRSASLKGNRHGVAQLLKMAEARRGKPIEGAHLEHLRIAIKEAAFAGRMGRGEAHYKAFLTADDVRDIRRQLAEGVYGITLAEQYKTTSSVISDIKIGRTWKHVLL